ncbi:hypothetical protein MRX96_033253 [Rhipicephalus microplus]
MLKLATGRALGNSSKFVASRNYTSIECGATAIRTPARSRGLVNWAATPATTSTGQRRRTMKERPPGAPNRVEKAARTPIRRQGAPELVDYYRDNGARAAEEVAKIPDPNVRQFVKTELDHMLKPEK